MRLGWTAPGRFRRRILESGFYQRHLQKLRCSLQSQTTRMVELIRAHFPAGTQVAEHTGGCVLWITLPGHIDAGGPVTQKLEEIVAQLGELTRRL